MVNVCTYRRFTFGYSAYASPVSQLFSATVTSQQCIYNDTTGYFVDVELRCAPHGALTQSPNSRGAGASACSSPRHVCPKPWPASCRSNLYVAGMQRTPAGWPAVRASFPILAFFPDMGAVIGFSSQHSIYFQFINVAGFQVNRALVKVSVEERCSRKERCPGLAPCPPGVLPAAPQAQEA